MIIARKKKKENIAEYIIYMWQLEDLVRAYDFDLEKIYNEIVEKYQESDSVKLEIKDWYRSLIDAMINEGLKEKGHLMQLQYLIQDLSDLNIKLLQDASQTRYNELFNEAIPNIAEIVKKSNGVIRNEIDACFVGLYGLFMMRLKKQEISESTIEACKTFSNLLAFLSKEYSKFEKGELE